MIRCNARSISFALLFGCAIALVHAGAAYAHHSGAMFEPQRVVTLTGTVRVFQWNNPHCYIQLLVRNDQGVTEEWSIEMVAPMHLVGRGVKKGTSKAGDRLTIKIHPLRNGDKGGEFVEATTAAGKPLGDQS